MKMKLLLWKLGNSTVCPYCKAELVPHFNERYSCYTANCRFNKGREEQ